MNENLQKINNVSISQIMKILTQSMKSRKYSPTEIALVQKEFLKQFDIEVSEAFIKCEELEVKEDDKSEDFIKLEDFLTRTEKEKICVLTIWREVLMKKGKPSKMQSMKISNIIDDFQEWEKMKNPSRFGEYGQQRGWKKIEML